MSIVRAMKKPTQKQLCLVSAFMALVLVAQYGLLVQVTRLNSKAIGEIRLTYGARDFHARRKYLPQGPMPAKANTEKETRVKAQHRGITEDGGSSLMTGRREETANRSGPRPLLPVDTTIKKLLSLLDAEAGKAETEIEPAPVGQPGEPGYNGSAVALSRADLSPEDRKKWDDGFKYGGYNIPISNMISLRRKIPQFKPKACNDIEYSSDLPRASIVLTYYKEALSVLLRSIHSIFDRAPDHLIEELLLVDDCSDEPQLNRPLEKYLQFFPKARIIRNRKREGLIRSRIIGAGLATAPVLVFTDGHVEFEDGWLEPLLQTVHRNKTTVALLTINFLRPSDFLVSPSWIEGNIHYFDFFMYQRVTFLSAEQRAARRDTDLIVAPGMTGSEFAIDREFFFELGAYDPGMEIWGAEDLEMAFKVWMCGGSMYQVPCSHVAHSFRAPMYRSWDKQMYNNYRVAAVWMDKYKYEVYERYGDCMKELGLKNIGERKKLRERLKCKSFEWYLDNIATMVYRSKNVINKGEIFNAKRKSCLSAWQLGYETGVEVKATWCHKKGQDQFWFLTPIGEIRKDEGCVSFEPFVSKLLFKRCHGMGKNQKWKHTSSGTFVYLPTKQCLEVIEDTSSIQLSHCTGKPEQIWNFRKGWTMEWPDP